MKVSTTTGGTATSGSDYLPLTSVTATFAPGTSSATVYLTVLGDAVQERTETVNLTLATASGGLLLVDTTATSSIVGDD